MNQKEIQMKNQSFSVMNNFGKFVKRSSFYTLLVHKTEPFCYFLQFSFFIFHFAFISTLIADFKEKLNWKLISSGKSGEGVPQWQFFMN